MINSCYAVPPNEVIPALPDRQADCPESETLSYLKDSGLVSLARMTLRVTFIINEYLPGEI